MYSSLSIAREAIAAEIKRLAADQTKLAKALAQLGGGTAGSGSSGPPTAKRKYTRRQQVGEPDVTAAVKLIEKAGKGGIKAIKLAHEIKRCGGIKPTKADLLATDKVRMTGTRGASTYIYTG